MNNKISSNEIIKYIDQNPWSKAIDIANHFAVTTMTIYRRLQVLVQQWIVTKKWGVPHVRYYPQVDQSSSNFRCFDPALNRLLNDERYQVSHIGQELIGTSWFAIRCKQRAQEPLAAAARRKGHIDYIDSIKTPYWILAEIIPTTTCKTCGMVIFMHFLSSVRQNTVLGWSLQKHTHR